MNKRINFNTVFYNFELYFTIIDGLDMIVCSM